MKPADKIERYLNDMHVTPDPEKDEQVLKAILAAQVETKQLTPVNRKLEIWRITMHSRITRSLAAATIVVVGVIGLNLLNEPSAWAIEQSIEAMENYRGFSCNGTITIPWTEFFEQLGVHDLPDLPEPTGEFELWAEADEGFSRTAQTKLCYPNGFTLLGSKLHAYMQLADGTTYDMAGDYMKMTIWPGSTSLRQLKDVADTWVELHGVDSETGRKRIFVKCSNKANRSWQFEFDYESKLLVNFKQWNTSSYHQGTPTIEQTRFVYYDQLPEDIFEIDLPESDKIFPVATPLTNPGHGISAEGLTQEEACYKIVKQVWQTINEHNFKTMRKLVPLAEHMNDDQIKSIIGNQPGAIKLLEMRDIYEGFLGPTVSCVYQEDGKKKVIDIVVMFREIDGLSSCVVYGIVTQPRPVE
ncbi:hypothetical protein ACFL6U_25565 [Planctomycetota bacterium]